MINERCKEPRRNDASSYLLCPNGNPMWPKKIDFNDIIDEVYVRSNSSKREFKLIPGNHFLKDRQGIALLIQKLAAQKLGVHAEGSTVPLLSANSNKRLLQSLHTAVQVILRMMVGELTTT